MKNSALRILFFCFLLSPVAQAADGLTVGKIQQALREDSCAHIDLVAAAKQVPDSVLPDNVPAVAAHSLAVRQYMAGDKQQSAISMACSVRLGGATSFYNAGSFYRSKNDDKALDFFLAGAVLGHRNAQAEAGELLLASAKSEREQMVAMALIAASWRGCPRFPSVQTQRFSLTNGNLLMAMVMYINAERVVQLHAGNQGTARNFAAILAGLRRLLPAPLLEQARASTIEFSKFRPDCVDYADLPATKPSREK